MVQGLGLLVAGSRFRVLGCVISCLAARSQQVFPESFPVR